MSGTEVIVEAPPPGLATSLDNAIIAFDAVFLAASLGLAGWSVVTVFKYRASRTRIAGYVLVGASMAFVVDMILQAAFNGLGVAGAFLTLQGFVGLTVLSDLASGFFQVVLVAAALYSARVNTPVKRILEAILAFAWFAIIIVAGAINGQILNDEGTLTSENQLNTIIKLINVDNDLGYALAGLTIIGFLDAAGSMLVAARQTRGRSQVHVAVSALILAATTLAFTLAARFAQPTDGSVVAAIILSEEISLANTFIFGVASCAMLWYLNVEMRRAHADARAEAIGVRGPKPTNIELHDV